MIPNQLQKQSFQHFIDWLVSELQRNSKRWTLQEEQENAESLMMTLEIDYTEEDKWCDKIVKRLSNRVYVCDTTLSIAKQFQTIEHRKPKFVSAEVIFMSSIYTY